MLNVLCFWFGALLAGLDSLILAAFAQMKLGPLHAEIAAQVSMVGSALRAFWRFALRNVPRVISKLHISSLARIGDFFHRKYALFGVAGIIQCLDPPICIHIFHFASARARRQATGRIEPRAKRQQQSEIEVS